MLSRTRRFTAFDRCPARGKLTANGAARRSDYGSRRAERLQVERAAAQAGLSTSEYVRAQVLNGRVIVRQSWTLGHAVFDELRRIGVNLNQLTRLAHQREQFPAGLSEVCTALEKLLVRELDAALDDRPPGTRGPGDGPDPAAKRESACGHSSSGAPATDDGS